MWPFVIGLSGDDVPECVCVNMFVAGHIEGLRNDFLTSSKRPSLFNVLRNVQDGI